MREFTSAGRIRPRACRCPSSRHRSAGCVTRTPSTLSARRN